MWVLGGYNETIAGSKNDIWMSSNGSQWQQITVTGSQWSARYFHSSLVYEHALWILGGVTTTSKNDIWKSYQWSELATSRSPITLDRTFRSFIFSTQ